MYHVAVSFVIPADHRDDFIRACQENHANSIATEPGTRRFECIADESEPGKFYLNEGYDSVDAFNDHANGPNFKHFFDVIGGFAEGPTWLIKGSTVAG